MTSVFKSVISDSRRSDKMYLFLKEVFHLFPEDKFHALIATTSRDKNNDEDIYRTVQKGLPGIKPFLSELTLALPALRKQKKEMTKQLLSIIGEKKTINGYLEIGSTGRYISHLRKQVEVKPPVFITNDIAPSNSVADIFERGQFRPIGQFFSLSNYDPISEATIASGSLDMVACHIGLHHCPLDRLPAYLASIHRVLRPGGYFIMREHDAGDPPMAAFVSLVHTVFNLGLNVPWETDAAEFKSFRSINDWVASITKAGFSDTGFRILQDNDPSANTLLGFIKI